MCYNIASILCLGVFGHKTSEILAPRPEIKPVPPALKGEVFNPWTAREVSTLLFARDFIYSFISGCAGSLLVPAGGCSKPGLLLNSGLWASHCGGFSCRGP